MRVRKTLSPHHMTRQSPNAVTDKLCRLQVRGTSSELTIFVSPARGTMISSTTGNEMSEPVLVERRGRIAIVTLNLPEKRNALGAALYPALSRTLAGLQDETSIRALVLHGGKHFCAGGDLAALDIDPLSMRDAMRIGHLAVRALIGVAFPL